MDGQAESRDCFGFGPVLNPSAPHGVAIIEVENEEQVPKIIAEDPAVIT
ncbi:hypothetical protein [Bacillus salipaludis]|nr:hypothetical protein [Bacillus salipaludis]